MNRSTILHRVFLLVAFALCLPRAAPACSCLPSDAGFLVEPGTELPADARGVPWSGRLEWDGQTLLPPGKDFFTVERLDGEAPGPVVFDLELLSGELLREHDVLALVAPRDGLEPGGRYRFTYRTRGIDPTTEAEKLPAKYRLEVRVAREPFTPGDEAGELTLWRWRRDRIVAETRGGMCSVTVDAALAGVELELPESVARWRDALLYVTRVDGEIYRPATGLCSQVPPGRSRVGTARELLFTVCGYPDYKGSVEDELAEGLHQVEMIAWLPGTGKTLRARREADLSCESVADRRTRDTLGEPISGLDPGRELTLLDEALVTLADGTRFAITLHGTEEPWPSRRLVVWKEGAEGVFSRFHVTDSGGLEFAFLERHDEVFLAIRDVYRSGESGPERSATIVYHLRPDRLAPLEVDRKGPCGADLPPLGLDWEARARPGYSFSDGEISFAAESDDGDYVAGDAAIVPRGKGFALAAVGCR